MPDLSRPKPAARYTLCGGTAPRPDGLGAIGRVSRTVPRVSGPNCSSGRDWSRATDDRRVGAADAGGGFQGSNHGDQSDPRRRRHLAAYFQSTGGLPVRITRLPAELPPAVFWSLPTRRFLRCHDRSADVLSGELRGKRNSEFELGANCQRSSRLHFVVFSDLILILVPFMRLSLGQDLRLVQKQVLAPRMIQSMEILQLSILALQERIEQEMALLEESQPPV